MDRRAQTALFDALVFLVIISIATAGLLSAFGSYASEDVEWESEMVSRCHSTLLECCLKVTGTNGTGDSPLRIGSVALTSFGSNGEPPTSLSGELASAARLILNSSLPAGTQWCWSLRSTSGEVSVGEEPPIDETLIASLIAISTQPQIESRLLAWRV